MWVQAQHVLKAAPVAQHPEAVCLDGSAAVVLRLFPHACKIFGLSFLELKPQQIHSALEQLSSLIIKINSSLH